jgi:hypothetical protein
MPADGAAASSRARSWASVLRPSREWIAPAAVTGAFLVAAAIFTWPAIVDLRSTILGQGGDVPESIRVLWALHEQHTTVFTATRDYLLGSPEGTAYQRVVAIAAPFFNGPLTILGLLFGWVAAFNLFGLIVFVLTGTATFLLLRRFRFRIPAAVFGAYVFTFNPQHLEKLFGAAPLAATGILPLVALALFAKRSRPSVRRSVLAGATIVAAFFLDPYLGLLAVWLAAVFAVVEFATVWRRGRRYDTVRSWYFVLLTVVIGVIPTAIAWWQDQATTASLAEARSQTLVGGSASLQSYLLPGPRNPWIGHPMSRWLVTNLSWEPSLFVGYTTMALALAGVVIAARRRRQGRLAAGEGFLVAFAVLLVVTAFWASLPPTVDVLGVGLPTPQWFIRHVTTVYRVFSRFGVLVELGLVVLAAYALSTIRRRTLGTAAAAIALVAVAFELFTGLPEKTTVEAALTPANVAQLATFESGRPKILEATRLLPYVRWLREHPAGLVADYPDPGDPNGLWAWRDLYRQSLHHHPLWEVSPGVDDASGLRTAAADLTSTITPIILAGQHVKWVVVHGNRYRALDEDVPRPARGLTRVVRLGDVIVYRVTASPNRLWSATAGLESTYNGELWPERIGFRWMGESATATVFSPCYGRVFLQGVGVSLNKPRTLLVYDASGTLVASQAILADQTWFHISIPVQHGFNTFQLRATPGGAVRGFGDKRKVTIALSSVTATAIPTSAGQQPACS